MSIHIGVGTSANPEAFLAGEEAAKAACQNAQENFFDLFLAFASAKFNQQNLLQGIKSVCPDAPIVGCSSAGEIINGETRQNSLVLIGFKGEALHFSLGLGCSLSQDGHLAGQKCAQEAVKAHIEKRHLFIMFPDGLSENVSEAIRGVQEVLGTSFPIVGGSAGDDFLFTKTHQYYQDKAFSDAVVGLLLGGELSASIGIRHGWRPIGKTHEVTKVKGNVISEIDAKVAFKLYEDYFGEQAKELQKLPWARIGTIYPLGILLADEEEYLIRYPFKATPEGDLVCAAPVPLGAQVRLMIADKDAVLTAAKEAAQEAKEGVKENKVLAVIIFDSIARKLVLGRHLGEEIEVIKKSVGKNIPLIGFYCYGEQAPLRGQKYIGSSYFHNETVVVLCLAENRA